jgi:L-ribulose-5-phosphate 3-epimerase
MASNQVTRRGFVRGVAGAVAAAGVIAGGGTVARGMDIDEPKPAGKAKWRKAMMFDLVGVGGSLEQRFAACRAAGFDGVEISTPVATLKHEEVLAAKAKTGIEIHGVCDAVHWQKRLSDPSEAVRAEGQAGLQQAIKDCHEFGGTTVLLVPGKVTNPDTESYEQVWSRSQEEIRKAIPLAKEKNVKIAVEVVWNGFWTKPEQMAQYLDEINEPGGGAAVGGYLDLGNVVKFGVPASQWVKVLNKRILKLHIKGYSHQKQWVNIGDGDEDWPEIVKALDEVGYKGWATAEVWARSIDELNDVSKRLDRVLA